MSILFLSVPLCAMKLSLEEQKPSAKLSFAEQLKVHFKQNLRVFLKEGNLPKIQQLLKDTDPYVSIEMSDIIEACLEHYFVSLPGEVVRDVIKAIEKQAELQVTHGAVKKSYEDFVLNVYTNKVSEILALCAQPGALARAQFLLMDLRLPAALMRNTNRDNPLHIAIDSKQFALARWLVLNFKECISLKNKQNVTPFELGVQKWGELDSWLAFIAEIATDSSALQAIQSAYKTANELNAQKIIEIAGKDYAIKAFMDLDAIDEIHRLIQNGVQVAMSDVMYAVKKDKKALFLFFLTLPHIKLVDVILSLSKMVEDAHSTPNLLGDSYFELLERYSTLANDLFTPAQ